MEYKKSIETQIMIWIIEFDQIELRDEDYYYKTLSFYLIFFTLRH